MHLVDDDASFLVAMKRRLELAGFDVRAYAAAEQFLEHQDDGQGPSCLVLDVDMTGLSGLELQSRLRVLGSTLPIVFVSGRADDRIRTTAIEAGAHDFLTKPINSGQLLRSIQAAIARHERVRPNDVLIASIHAQDASDKSIVVASTTSPEDSGLFGHILPLFKQKTGISVKVVAQGTGQALDTGRRGEADVVLVHAKSEEEKFLSEGQGVKRYPVMYNDFVLVGPKSNPAGIKGMEDITAALKKIMIKNASFISRSDRSGTHIAELDLWKAAGVDIDQEAGSWYKSICQGMGTALEIAVASDAYVLSDRGTWLKNKRDLVIEVEGDARLLNQYGVMLVNPAKHPNVQKEAGQAFIDWMISSEGQKAITDYRINGEQLFWRHWLS